MDSQVTQCPFCDTAFRVSPDQLALASGMVRCGSCLQVFYAPDYVKAGIQPDHQSSSAHDQEGAVDAATAEADIPEIDDEVASDTETDNARGPEAPPGSSNPYLSYPPLPDVTDPRRTELDGALKEESTASDDADSAELSDPEMMSETDHASDPPPAVSAPLSVPVADAGEVLWVGAESLDVVDAASEAGDSEIPDSADPDRELVSDFGEEQQVSAEPAPGPETDGEEIVPEAGPPETESPDLPVRAETEETSDTTDLSAAVLENLRVEAESPELILGEPVPPPVRGRLLWFAGAVLLGMVLVAQYGYFNRDRLVQLPDARGWYETICRYAGCVLPVYRDYSAFRTVRLLVRSHPEVPGALAVDAVIRNSAIYRQKFPRLALSFTDINNQIVARRIFEPDEYLGGELTGLKYFPPSTEVRLALEILDPGQAAVGYSLVPVENN
ncbi:MAG: DUF3426 domain-containing protein [Pseudomonadales bacterium]|nr:DUF3426 domain-containing protein [Pseudomonadales bacterium]